MGNYSRKPPTIQAEQFIVAGTWPPEVHQTGGQYFITLANGLEGEITDTDWVVYTGSMGCIVMPDADFTAQYDPA